MVKHKVGAPSLLFICVGDAKCWLPSHLLDLSRNTDVLVWRFASNFGHHQYLYTSGPGCLFIGSCGAFGPQEGYKNILPLYYVRRETMLNWRSSIPPTLDKWNSLINSVLPLYKTTYNSRGCPTKFDKVWSA